MCAVVVPDRRPLYYVTAPAVSVAVTVAVTVQILDHQQLLSWPRGYYACVVIFTGLWHASPRGHLFTRSGMHMCQLQCSLLPPRRGGGGGDSAGWAAGSCLAVQRWQSQQHCRRTCLCCCAAAHAVDGCQTCLYTASDMFVVSVVLSFCSHLLCVCVVCKLCVLVVVMSSRTTATLTHGQSVTTGL